MHCSHNSLKAILIFCIVGEFFPAFVLKLVTKEEILKENVQISPKSKGVEDMNLVQSGSDIDVDEEISAVSMSCRGTTGYIWIVFFFPSVTIFNLYLQSSNFS